MKISIITINYNNIAGLQLTCESVWSQLWQDFEHIIIDGGSTDGSKEFIKQNQGKVAYWVSEADRGVYHAMNKGVKEATGVYTWFLNSGDYFIKPSSLGSFIKKSQSLKSYDLFYGDLMIKEPLNNLPWVKKYPSVLNYEYFYRESLPHPASMVKTKRLLQHPFDERLKVTSDWKFFVELICKYEGSYAKIDFSPVLFHLDGISANNAQLSHQERFDYIHKNFPVHYDSKTGAFIKIIKLILGKIRALPK